MADKKYNRQRRITKAQKDMFAACLSLYNSKADAYRAVFPNATKNKDDQEIYSRAHDLSNDEYVVKRVDEVKKMAASSIPDLAEMLGVVVNRYMKFAQVDTDAIVKQVLETGTMDGVDVDNSVIKTVRYMERKDGSRYISSLSFNSQKEALDGIREMARLHLEERDRKKKEDDSEVNVKQIVNVREKPPVMAHNNGDEVVFEAK